MKKVADGWLFYVVAALLFDMALYGAHADKEIMRLVVSAGALAEQNPFSAFYQSRIFKSEELAPFVVVNAAAVAFETDGAIFYASAVASPEQKKSFTARVLVGQSYRGILLKGDPSEGIRRHLGADSVDTKIEKKEVDGIEYFAVSKTEGDGIIWPKSFSELRRVPAVIVEDKAKNTRYILVARSVGAIGQRIAVVDAMLAKKTSAAAWIDLGTSHGSGIISSASLDVARKRPLLSVFAGSLELLALLNDKDKIAPLPLTAPFAGQAKRTVTVGDETINFWSVAHNEKLWPLYERLGKNVSALDAINLMKEEVDQVSRRGINVVQVYSEQAAAFLARSVYVDLVLLLANDPYAQLPTREFIELRKAESDAYEQIAPIVRIANLDASEIHIFQRGSQKIQRVEVVRQGFSDDVGRAQDAPVYQMPSSNVALAKNDSRAWEKSDVEKVLGGLMLAETKSDLAIFPELSPITKIDSAIPFELAKNIMEPSGNAVVAIISGRQIKRIAKLISSNRFSRKHIIYGLDSRSATIGNRPINDKERFAVALSESALLDLFGLSRLGGLAEDYPMRAPFVAAIYADSRQLFYVGGPKNIPISDSADEIERAVRDISAGVSFDDIMSRGLAQLSAEKAQSYIDMAAGQPRHVITLDIAYLDFGISKNVVNDNYQEASGSFPTSRGGIKPYAHLFVFTKIALNYETPVVNSSLFNEIKYMHTDPNDKPEKDKTKLGLKLRLPWEQSYFKDRDVVISPIFNNTYETKLAPNPWADNAKVRAKPRTQRIDSLLGINVDFTKLGFNIDVGAAMATDFNRFNVNDALDFGPGINFLGKWRLFGPVELSSEISSVYLFPLPKNQALNKIALGVEGAVWLRLARFYDFGVDAMSDFLVATLQHEPKKFILSSIFGLTISYGRLFRLLG